jgi:hypothetical protein
MEQTKTCARGGGAVNIMPDFGTMHENAAAFDIAVTAITRGEIAWGRALLAALQDHIVRTAEPKSAQWILPQVREALDALEVEQELWNWLSSKTMVGRAKDVEPQETRVVLPKGRGPG